MPIVPNKFPSTPSTKKLCIVGEAPGSEEERLGQPFVGASGRFLAALLSRAGISKEACFLGNISQHRPPNNNFALFSWNGIEVQHGLDRLRHDIEAFNPNMVVLLGNMALKAAKDMGNGNTNPKAVRFKTSQWRGSLFRCEDADSPFQGRKCMATYHPAYVLRDYDMAAYLQLDLRKAVEQSVSPELRTIPRTVFVPQTSSEAVLAMADFQVAKKKTAFDIEGYWNNLKCIGFCNDISRAVVIPLQHLDGRRYWDAAGECQVFRAISDLCEDPSVPKVAQAGLYDRFCLDYGHGIRVRNVTDDTMLKHWAIYSELAKDADKKKGHKGMGLAIQVSLYTDMPYYKGERETSDDTQFYEYCGQDCMATLEIDQVIEGYFRSNGDKSRFTKAELQSMERQYRFNVALNNAFFYMEKRGMAYNSQGAKQRCQALLTQLHRCQYEFNYLTGHGFHPLTKDSINTRIRALMLTKKGDRPRKEYEPVLARVKDLVALPFPSAATLGELEDLCEVSLNVDSSKQFIPYLYETLQLPVQYKEQPRGSTEPPRPTADYEALLKLSRELQKGDGDGRLPIVQKAIELRSLSTRAGMLEISADDDGRIRCGYNIVGTNTGRVTCYESPTGSGYNLQTIPNYSDPANAPGGILGDRDLFRADDDHFFFQCDLAGADGWTVAAYSAMLGDSGMLDDYRFGIRPFERLTLKILGKEVPKDREELRAACKEHVKKEGWPRFASKRIQHGGSYMEGALTVSRNILKDSEGKLYIPPKECQLLLDYWFQLYWGIKRWHEWVARRIKERPVLTAASGQVRQFFGRPDDILTKAVAFEPQANTTYATNLAMYRLWTDPENDLGKENGGHSSELQHPQLESPPRISRLRVEPLHQVHDALCGQFKKSDTTWALSAIKRYFANPLQIAGQTITIPFDGGYGPSWGELPNKI